MSPKDPVQQATPRRLGRLVPVQVRGQCPLGPEYIKVIKALSLDHLQRGRGERINKETQEIERGDK